MAPTSNGKEAIIRTERELTISATRLTLYVIKRQFALFHSEKLSHMKGSSMNNTSRTDWARIDAMSDDEIDTSDIPLA
jgi:hypothetical protein